MTVHLLASLLRPVALRRGRRPALLMLLILPALLLSACDTESLPGAVPQVPDELRNLAGELRSLPGVPESLDEVGDMLAELGIPDLAGLANLPQVNDLPIFRDEPSTISFNGPLERNIQVGETIPGTPIQLVSVGEESAEFLIDGLRSTRLVGDSLDHDGAWPTLPGATYNLRLRLYRIGTGSVRVAGVHQLTIRDIAPQPGSVTWSTDELRFPFTTNPGPGDTIKGTTLGYDDVDDRGAIITGLDADVYPYRKVGDSIRWSGLLRSDIGVEYNLRMLNYGDGGARVGGLVTLYVPRQ